MVPRVSVLITKEADFFWKRRKSMDIVYKKVNAQITPETLAKLKQKKIIFEDLTILS